MRSWPSCSWRSFLDRMITLVEGAARRKTPNEVAPFIGIKLIDLLVHNLLGG